MIRWLILPALALALGGLLAAQLGDDPGYVLIQIAGYTLESSVAGLVFLSVVSVVLVLLGLKFFNASVRMPGRVGEILQDRRLNQARKQLRLGLNELAAGQWERAEMELLKRIADADEPGTHYLYAAQAAHQLGKSQRRDDYLALADQSGPQHHSAVLLKRAELWAADGRHVEALDALDVLLAEQPRNRAAVALRLDLLAREGRWETLRDALSAARSLLPHDQVDRYVLQVHRELLSQARASGRLEALRTAWQHVPKAQQQDAGLIAHYALLCHDLNADADGIRLIVAALRQAWHPELVRVFGELDGGDVVRQLSKVENWITQHGEKPELMLVAGRLCLRNRLWGRARSYFEACLRSYPSPEIRLELGKLLIQQGDDDKAALELFREGLESSLKPDRPEQEWLAADKSLESAP